MGRAMGGWSERLERPEDTAGTFPGRERPLGRAGGLLELITSQETRFSNRGVLR